MSNCLVRALGVPHEEGHRHARARRQHHLWEGEGAVRRGRRHSKIIPPHSYTYDFELKTVQHEGNGGGKIIYIQYVKKIVDE